VWCDGENIIVLAFCIWSISHVDVALSIGLRQSLAPSSSCRF